MYFEQIVRDDLGCAAYLIGATDAGVAAAVDPRLDMVEEVLALVARQGLRLTRVVETHTHADHVSGRDELVQATGAVASIHPAAQAAYPHEALVDGARLALGEVVVEVLHTPGHRPEHVALAVADTSRSDEPWLVLTGDALFVGDVGRPDLAVPLEEGARQLHASLFERLLCLPDWVEVYPAHLAGSLCGRVTNRKTSSTIGYERRHNRALAPRPVAEFARGLTAGLPPRPPNMLAVVERNRSGGSRAAAPPVPLAPAEFARRMGEGATVLDTRSPAGFGAGHVPAAVNVPVAGGQFGTRVGFVVPPDARLLLVLGSERDPERVGEALAVVGYDAIAGYLAGGMSAWRAGGGDVATVPQVPVEELAGRLGGSEPVAVLDVREDAEWDAGHIAGATHLPFHQLAAHPDRVPEGRLAVVCSSGVRSSLAASLLQRAGRPDVANVAGGMTAWRAAGLPITKH